MKCVLALMALLCSFHVFARELPLGLLDRKLQEIGFVDVASIDSAIVVDLMYARDDNFVGKAMYDQSMTHAWLHPEAAGALKAAQHELTRLHPGWALKICDATRPMSVQKIMYQTVRGTSKAKYVSNPVNGGGLHNYGLAVDVTIVDSDGNELDMGTKVDHLGVEANIDNEAGLVDRGKISIEAVANRKLLRAVMRKGGFRPLTSEWWHFNLRSRAQARSSYLLIDF